MASAKPERLTEIGAKPERLAEIGTRVHSWHYHRLFYSPPGPVRGKVKGNNQRTERQRIQSPFQSWYPPYVIDTIIIIEGGF